MNKKFKILAAGDLHGDASLSKKLSTQAKKEKVDLIILCGDLTFADQFGKGLMYPFVKNNQKVLIIPGNHDSFATTDFFAEFYGLKNIHGYHAIYKDIGIFGCGGADIGIEQLTDDEIFNHLKRGFGKIKNLNKKIMVTHMHAEDSKAEFSGFKGSKAIKKAIKKFQPDILLSGHIHEAEGIEEKVGKTLVINVGRKGKIIEI
ncbi:metallophosphoesterase [archaeon]|nr:metallophosphoesterase [archaeon]